MTAPALPLADALAAMDAAYDAKGRAARDLKAAVNLLKIAKTHPSPDDAVISSRRGLVRDRRTAFTTAARRLAHAEAAFAAAEAAQLADAA